MSETTTTPVGGKPGGVPVGAVLVLVGGIAAGIGVFLTWIKVNSVNVNVDFAGGTVQGQQVPPIHVTRAVPIPGTPTGTGWGHWSGKAILALAIALLIIGAVMLVQRASGRGLAASALVLGVLAGIVCIYVFTQKNALVRQAAKDAYKQETGKDLQTALNQAIAGQRIPGLTAAFTFSASMQFGFIISALGSLVACIGGVLGLASSGTPTGVGAAAYSSGVQVTPTAGWGAPPPADVPPTATPPAYAPPVPAPTPVPPEPPAPSAEPEGGGDEATS